MSMKLYEAIRSAAQERPSELALLAADHLHSYAELERSIASLAASLREVGVQEQRVGVLMPNAPAFPIAVQAVLRAGATAVLVNPVSRPREIEEQFADAGVRTTIVVPRIAERLPIGLARILVIDAATGELVGEVKDSQGEAGGGAAPERRYDEAVIIFTAATSGRARGAVLSHANLLSNARSTVDAMRLGPGDRVLAALPFVHAFGFTVCLQAPLIAGAAVAPVGRFNPVRMLEAIEELEITVLCGVPAIYHALLAAAETRPVSSQRLRVALCGGAPMPLDLGRRWEEKFRTPLRQGYGLTEASPVCTFNRVDRQNRPGTLGEPLPGIEVSIRGPAGEPLAEGEVGEICIRGANVFGGYLDGRRDGTFTNDGWLRSGDLGSVREGVVRFHGTLKPMFTRNGFNIYPAEIRRVLEAHPAIARAVVYGRSDPVRENEIVISVRPEPGSGLDARAVRNICAEKLAPYKQPTDVRMIRDDDGVGIE